MIGRIRMSQLNSHALCLLTLMLSVSSLCQSRADDASILNACRRFLNADGQPEASSAAEITAFDGDIEDVINAMSLAEPTDHRNISGVITNQPFLHPEFKNNHAGDLLHYFVPEDYLPAKPFGLIIFMHGGGGTTLAEHAAHIVTNPDDDPQSIGLQPHIASLPFILVAPSAPKNEKTGARWNVREADEYINDVIRECRYRYNVDTDRIFLGGYSMGGFGAYHLCQRLSDRLAGGFIFSGAWKTMHWKAWTGLPLFIRHGINDAAPAGQTPAGQNGTNGRPRFTDVFYARTANQRLIELDLPHVYVEDKGNHAIRPATDAMIQMADWIQHPRRDPYAKHVVAVSPRGWKAETDTPTPHCRWVTIHESGGGTIDFDQVTMNGPRPTFGESADDFEKQSFMLKPLAVKAGFVDARIVSQNRIVIATRNVRRLSIWLHPSMVNFSDPVSVSLNGNEREHTVKATLMQAIRSYKRRTDWHLIYPAEIVLNCPEE